MPEDDDIVRIPQTNKKLGSCPGCGSPIWESNKLKPDVKHPNPIYVCLLCKEIFSKDRIIPF